MELQFQYKIKGVSPLGPINIGSFTKDNKNLILRMMTFSATQVMQ